MPHLQPAPRVSLPNSKPGEYRRKLSKNRSYIYFSSLKSRSSQRSTSPSTSSSFWSLLSTCKSAQTKGNPLSLLFQFEKRWEWRRRLPHFHRRVLQDLPNPLCPLQFLFRSSKSSTQHHVPAEQRSLRNSWKLLKRKCCPYSVQLYSNHTHHADSRSLSYCLLGSHVHRLCPLLWTATPEFHGPTRRPPALQFALPRQPTAPLQGRRSIDHSSFLIASLPKRPIRFRFCVNEKC